MKRKSADTCTATRIAFSKNLNAGKYAELHEQARRLGIVRSEVWQRYGSIAGVGVRDRTIRDGWLKAGRKFDVNATAWKETLRDAKGDITANMEAAKVKARRAIRCHTRDESEQKRLFGLLKFDQFAADPYLRRIMRKYWRRGHNRTTHQIVVRSDHYSTFQAGGKAWVKVPGLTPGKRIAIPLNTTVEPTGTLRLILRRGLVEVHYAVELPKTADCGGKIVGVDKGYSEVLVDSDGHHHGEGLGERLKAESDRLKLKYQRRSKLRAIAEKSAPAKRARIEKNNLGRTKLDRRARRIESNVRDVVFKAVHAVADKASVIAAEDLTAPISGRKFGKNVNRRLAGWTKGVIAEALASVSRRRSSTLVLVNPAYTSQIDHRNGCLLGKRSGDRFYCFDGVVLPADENAARNVKARLSDPEIDRWTPYQKVKSILLSRTERFRLGLLNQDPSCAPQGPSTGSESPEQLCLSF